MGVTGALLGATALALLIHSPASRSAFKILALGCGLLAIGVASRVTA